MPTIVNQANPLEVLHNAYDLYFSLNRTFGIGKTYDTGIRTTPTDKRKHKVFFFDKIAHVTLNLRFT